MGVLPSGPKHRSHRENEKTAGIGGPNPPTPINFAARILFDEQDFRISIYSLDKSLNIEILKIILYSVWLLITNRLYVLYAFKQKMPVSKSLISLFPSVRITTFNCKTEGN